jgi:hypothetical protein
MLNFRKGDKVRQVVKPVEGEVMGATVVDDDHVQYEVSWTEADGSVGTRFFTEEQLELVERPAPAAEGAQ